MIPEELRPALKQVVEQLRSVRSFLAVGLASEMPRWMGLTLSEIMVLANGAEISYVTGTRDSDNKTARILVLTSAHLIEAVVSEIDGASAQRVVRAVPRSGIRSVAVEAGETPFSSSEFSDWPGELTITASYEGIASPAIFPLEVTQGDDATLRDLVTHLLRDLKS